MVPVDRLQREGDASCEDDRILSQDTTQEMAEKVSPFPLLGQIQWKKKKYFVGHLLSWLDGHGS